MKAMALVAVAPPSPSHLLRSSTTALNPRHRRNLSSFSVSCSSVQSEPLKSSADSTRRTEYKPGLLDDLFLTLFRNKMVKEVEWDSEKAGYEGLIEVANRLMLKGNTNSDTKDAAVRILRSLFPPFLLELYKLLISPIGEGKVAAVMVARVTALTCQWLMGPCKVNMVELADGTSCESGVFVERCKYLEESKCVGICINTCKLPTQEFFINDMGVPLLMEPNFADYSCQLFDHTQTNPHSSCGWRQPKGFEHGYSRKIDRPHTGAQHGLTPARFCRDLTIHPLRIPGSSSSLTHRFKPRL